jgi:hypothetical protein
MQRNEDRNKQLELLRHRYQGRGKEGKSRLLDEFCEHYSYERKYALKLLGTAVEELRPKHSPPVRSQIRSGQWRHYAGLGGR